MQKEAWTCHLLKGEGHGRMRHGEGDEESVWDMLTLRCHLDICENIVGIQGGLREKS